MDEEEEEIDVKKRKKPGTHFRNSKDLSKESPRLLGPNADQIEENEHEEDEIY